MNNENTEKLKFRKDATKTYIEQTKHLASLATIFIIPPAGVFLFLENVKIWLFILSEVFFLISIIFSYVVLGSIVGSQDKGTYDIYRNATRISSLIQFFTYLLGLFFFFLMVLLST